MLKCHRVVRRVWLRHGVHGIDMCSQPDVQTLNSIGSRLLLILLMACDLLKVRER